MFEAADMKRMATYALALLNGGCFLFNNSMMIEECGRLPLLRQALVNTRRQIAYPVGDGMPSLVAVVDIVRIKTWQLSNDIRHLFQLVVGITCLGLCVFCAKASNLLNQNTEMIKACTGGWYSRQSLNHHGAARRTNIS